MKNNRKNIIEFPLFDRNMCLRSTLIKNFERFVEYSLNSTLYFFWASRVRGANYSVMNFSGKGFFTLPEKFI